MPPITKRYMMPRKRRPISYAPLPQGCYARYWRPTLYRISRRCAPLASHPKSGADRQIVNGRLKKTVALIGMMGAGKTAVGGQVARMLDVPFLDSDDQIERAANMTVAEIFTRDGEDFFRRKESLVLARLMAGRPVVLSTGGGAFLQPANRTLISERGVSVWLRADLDLLWERVRHRSTRPLLKTPNPRETLRLLLETRAPVYALADIIVDAVPGHSIETTAGRVIEALTTRPDVLEG